MDKDIYDFNKFTFEEILELTKNDLLEFTGMANVDFKLAPNDSRHITVDITTWKLTEKELLFSDYLKGIHFFYKMFSDKKTFNIGTYNEVIQATKGVNTIQIYTESIKWFTPEIKKKLKKNNYSFPDLHSI